MKLKLLFLSLMAATAGVFAQEHHHHAGAYNISVYKNFKDLPVSKRIDQAANKRKVNTQFPNWYVFSDKLTGKFSDITGQAVSIPGNSVEAKAAYCFNNQLKALGIDGGEWLRTQNTDADFAKTVNYKQSINGHEVIFSRLSFKFSGDEKLMRIQHKSFGMPVYAAPVLSVRDALAAAGSDLSAVKIDHAAIDENWVWFPVPSRNGYELKPSWAFTIYGHDNYLPVELTGYVDGLTGEILYRTNGVHETADLTITGSVYKQNPLSAASAEPLVDLLINVGAGNYYTDSLGYFSDATLSTPVNATLNLQGRWSTVNDQMASGATPSYTHTINATGTTTLFDTSAVNGFNDRLVNAYYHTTRVHNFMKGYFPTFTGMDFSLNTNVDLTNSTCNAFYSGGNSSINFYAASGNCNSFAYCGDIIYHEYGHGINHKYYQSQGAGSMGNGALNEAYADIWGIGITHDPVLGRGAFANGNVIRRYDQSPKVYPQHIVGEVHADGEIIAGAWWDVAQNIGSVDTMLQIFTRTYIDVVDGPNGTEGEVYHAALISALEHDDDDNNITNGTPHFMQIISAFARHGIHLLQDAEVVHEDIPNAFSSTPVTINASVVVSEPAFLQGLKIYYKERAATAWDSLVMTPTGAANYTAILPGFPEGSIVDYYFAVYDVYAILNKYAPVNYTPNTSPSMNNIIYQFGVGLTWIVKEDFEGTLDAAWQIGLPTDNATSGEWIHASPVPSFAGGLPVQPGVDHTTNSATGKCLVTGNAAGATSPAGQADVDGGVTSVVTPTFDVSSFTDPIIEYYRWYGNDRGSNRGNDYWAVYVKTPTSTGFLVDYTNKSDYSWRRRIFRVRQYYTAALPSNLQLKFIASDNMVSSLPNNGQSTVEAAVDDLFIYDKEDITSAADVTTAKAQIYPNPANSEIHINFTKQYKGVITLNDITGKELMKIEMDGNGANYVLPVSSLANGTYTVVIHLGSSIQTSKVTIMH